jgi:nucleotide-binding universal stress UspA family protein
MDYPRPTEQRPEGTMYKRILLAYDGSETGQKALLDCRDIAAWGSSDIHLVAVMPPPAAFIGGETFVYDAAVEQEEKRQFDAVLQEGLRRLATDGRAATGEVVTGDAVDELTRCAAKMDADLIVVGHKHLGSWAVRWWRGSVSKSLIEQSPVSVLVVITR